MALITKSRRALLLVIVLAILGILGVRQIGKAALRDAIAEYSSEAGPVTAASYAPADVDKNLNMARWLQAGVQVLDLEMAERGFLRDFVRENPAQPDEQTGQRVAELIRRNEFPLQILMKAAPLKQSSLGLRYGDNIELELPNLLEYLQASFLLGAKWRLEMQNQDLAAATQTALLQERISAALTHEPVAIIGFIGHVPEKDLYEFISRNLNTNDESMLKMQRDWIHHLKSMATPLDRVIAADGAAVYSSLAEKFLQEEYFEQEPLPASQRILLRTSYVFNRPYFLAKMLGTYTDILHLARRPVSTSRDSSLDRSWVSAMFFSSNVEALVRRYQAQEAARSLAMTAIDLRLQGLREGRYQKPVNLPKSIYTGETAHYRVLPDGSVELSFPQTIRLWDERFAKGPPERPRLLWKLSAVSL